MSKAAPCAQMGVNFQAPWTPTLRHMNTQVSQYHGSYIFGLTNFPGLFQHSRLRLIRPHQNINIFVRINHSDELKVPFNI